jgi:hypothetical protein
MAFERDISRVRSYCHNDKGLIQFLKYGLNKYSLYHPQIKMYNIFKKLHPCGIKRRPSTAFNE